MKGKLVKNLAKENCHEGIHVKVNDKSQLVNDDNLGKRNEEKLRI